MENNVQKQFDLIKRGSVEVISEDLLKLKLQKALRHNTPLRIKAGFDPTMPDLHLGHTGVIIQA